MKAMCAVVCLLAAAGLFGQTAETALVREVTGTVEIRAAGETEWTAVRRGQRLPGDSVISTGFNSQAIISLGNSAVTVRPLSRLSVNGLFREGNREEVKLDLRIGRIRADVKPPAGGKVEFVARSSVGTASVRGTVFEFDTLNLAVSEGTVAFAGASGAPVLVDAGGATFVDGTTGRPLPPAETAAAALRPELPQGAGDVVTVSGAAEAAPQGDLSLNVTISV
jgi:hypothetical protein